MHLIGRNNESSAVAQFAARGEQSRLSDIAQQHVRFLHVIERRRERARDRFLHQTFAQANAQVARQNLDDVLAFARGEPCQALLQKFRLGERPARFVQVVEELLRFDQGERRRACPAVERFERGLARVAVAAGDAVEIGIVQPASPRGAARKMTAQPTCNVRGSLCAKALPVR